jgi:predicted ester cyclase
MATEDNKALVRRFYEEVWSNGNYQIADEIFAPDYLRHDLRPTQAAPGPEGQKQIARAFRTAFPDLRFDVEMVIAEDDYVVARWTASGTHTGPWGGIEPTGRSVAFWRERLPARGRPRGRDLEPPRRPGAAGPTGSLRLRGRCAARLTSPSSPIPGKAIARALREPRDRSWQNHCTSTSAGHSSAKG